MSQSYEVIFENNRKWQETKRQQYPDYFKDLADGQNPEYLYIGCSDSRVAAEELMGVEPVTCLYTATLPTLFTV